MERNKFTGTIGETVMLEYNTIKLLNKYGIYREEILLEACPKFKSQFSVALKKSKGNTLKGTQRYWPWVYAIFDELKLLL